MIVAIVGFDDRVLQRAHVDGETAEHAFVVAVIDPCVALAEQAVEAVAHDAVAIDLAAHVHMRGADALRVVAHSDFPQVIIGRPLRDEIEHAGRIGRSV